MPISKEEVEARALLQCEYTNCSNQLGKTPIVEWIEGVKHSYCSLNCMLRERKLREGLEPVLEFEKPPRNLIQEQLDKLDKQ